MRYFFMLCIVVQLTSVSFFWHGAWYDTCELRSFKATAYYSPEEGQEFYVKWSLEEDKILNWEGTHGASWKAVFNGMIAAPKSYAFGTSIYIPWWWIGRVEDRGWAIVEAWERNEAYDRLDFWAWRWQQWLDTALRFWVRYFDAYVCPKGVWNEFWFDFSRIPLERKLPATLRDIDLSPGVISSRTPILQRYLKTMWYMPNVEESLHYGTNTTRAVCLYQQKVMGMSAKSQRCWLFWEQTRLSLRTTVRSFAHNSDVDEVDQPDVQIAATVKQEEVFPVAVHTPPVEDTLSARLFVQWGEFDGYVFGPLAPGDSWQEVRILQRKLQWLWHYPKDVAVSGIYDAQTIRAVYGFQLAQWLLVADIDPSVYGYLWPKTRAKINSV